MRVSQLSLPSPRRLFAFIAMAALLLTVLPGAAQANHVIIKDDGGLVTSVRWAGETRYDTASKLAVEGTAAAISTPATSAILATGQNFPDALAGSYLSGAVGGPILLTEQNAIPAETLARLTGTEASSLTAVDTVYLLGGPVAISQGVENQLTGLGLTVVRLAGETRVETAAKIATEAPGATPGKIDGLTTAILATASNFPDALVAGAASRNGSLPLLLTATNGLPQATVAALQTLEIQQVVIAGGEVAVSGAVEDALQQLGYQTRRIAGETRDHTAVEFARFNVAELDFTTNEIGLARNNNFPDALAFAPFAGREGLSIVLTAPTALPTVTAGYLTEIASCQFDTLYIPGGEVAVSAAVETAARQALTAANCGGIDNVGPSLATATVVSLGAPADSSRTRPADGDAILQLNYNEAVTCTGDAPVQFTLIAGDGTRTSATSVDCTRSVRVTLGFPAGTLDNLDGASLTYVKAGNPAARVYDLFGNEATNNDVIDTFAVAVPAEVLDVNSTDDQVDAEPGDGICETSDDGECSLRAAIMEANSNPNLTQINVPEGTYDITRTGRNEDGDVTGDLDITTDTILVGTDAIVDGKSLDRVFDVIGDITVSIDGLTITGGNANGDAERGGGLRSTGATVDISNSTFDGNRAKQAGGGIENTGGAMTLTNVDLTNNLTGETPGNGGGLHAAGGTTDILAGVVRGNTAVEGGGLWIGGGGSMSVTDVLIDQNEAFGATADAGDRKGGGGIYNDGATLVVSGSTLSGNTAIVGAGSGGGLLTTGDTGVVLMDDTAITGNTADRAGGGIENDGSDVTLGATAPNAIVGNTATGTNSAGNGGGIHAVGPTVLNEDTVTGNTAVEGGGLWIGGGSAMALDGTLVTANTSLGDTADAGDRKGGGGIYNDGATLDVANSTISGNTATEGAGSGGGILTTGDTGVVTISGSSIAGNTADRAGGGIENDGSDLTLDGTNEVTDNIATGTNSAGNGGGIHAVGPTSLGTDTVSGNSAIEGGGLWIGGGATMDLDGTTVDANEALGGDAVTPGERQGGGGVYNDGATLDIANSTISNNVAITGAGSGGGILTAGGTGVVTISGSDITGNTADRAGGGIENDGSDLTLDGTNEVSGNTATGTNSAGNGGGIHAVGPTALGADLVDGNTAVEGGGLWIGGGQTLTLTGTTVSNNVANAEELGQGGGGVYVDGAAASLDADGVTFDGNSAEGADDASGGGVILLEGSATIANSTFTANTALRAGGGIELAGIAATSNLTLTDTDFDANTTGPTPGNGGAIHVTSGGFVEATDGEVTNNIAAREGGGFWNQAGTTMTIFGTNFADNIANGPAADDGGGAIFNNGGSLQVAAGDYDRNLSTVGNGSGGAIHSTNGSVVVDGANFTDNLAARAGGAIEIAGGTLDVGGMTPSNFTTNQATTGDGTAAGNGGAIHGGGGTDLAITGGTADGNSADEGGGFWAAGIMDVTSVVFTNNVATGDGGGTTGAGPGGGALFNQSGTLTIDDSTIGTPEGPNLAEGTVAPGNGGGLLSNGGSVTIIGTSFEGNRANRAGGAIEVTGGTLTTTGTTFTNNVATGATAPGNGGAIHNAGGDVTVNGGSATGNRAGGDGGAFWTNTQFEVNGTTVTGNMAEEEGGAFYNTTSVATAGNFDFINVNAMNGGHEVVDISVAVPDSKDDADVFGNVYAEGGVGPATSSAIGSTFTDTLYSTTGDDEATCSDIVDGDATLAGGNSDDDGTCFGAGVDTVFVVNTTTDAVDDDLTDGTCETAVVGECSLRAAVMQANQDASPQTITFSVTDVALTTAGAGDADAATGDLDITNDVTIDGAGAVTVNGAALGDRIFDVAGADVTISGMTLDGGTATATAADRGGALRQDAASEVTISSSTISNNDATQAGGGLENTGGVLTVTDTDFTGNDGGSTTGNGGAIHAGGGTTTVTGGLVDDNEADEGGGFWSSGTLTVNTVTFTNNVATSEVDGLGGGALFNQGGTLDVNDSTIGTTGNGNHADGDAVAGSGGGLFTNGGTLTVDGSSFTDNTADRAGGGIEIGGTVAATPTIGTTDFTNNSANANVTLVAGNGGAIHTTNQPITITDGVVTGNTAVEGGGFWNGTATMTITGTTFTTNVATGTDATNGGGGVFNNGGTLNSAAVVYTGNTAILGNGSGGGLHSTAGTVTVNGGSFTDNDAARAGGGIEIAAGTLVLGGMTVTDFTTNEATTGDGTAAGNGGAVHGGGGTTLTITGGTFDGNVADEGGGVWGAGLTTINGSTFINNAALSNGTGAAMTPAGPGPGGGALFNQGGTMDIDNATIGTAGNGNHADGNAGNGNASGSGGGIFNNGGTLTVDDSEFADNTADRAGGGIEVANIPGTSVTIGNTVFTSNSANANVTLAAGNGGAIHQAGGASTITSTVFGFNTAVEGGAVWLGGGGTMNLGNGLAGPADVGLILNTAARGGAIYNDGNGGATNLVLANVSAIIGNAAAEPGGGNVYGEETAAAGVDASGGGNEFGDDDGAAQLTCQTDDAGPIGFEPPNSDDDDTCFVDLP